MRIVNPVTISPADLDAGDVMVATITLHVVRRGGQLFYRLYRCNYPPETFEDVPQGQRIMNEQPVMETLFPVAGWAGAEPDVF